MATIHVRYLICRPGAAGALPRWFWQPGPKLRAEGWRPHRIPFDYSRHTDAGELQRAAISTAEALNSRVDAAHQVAGRAASAALRGHVEALSSAPATSQNTTANLRSRGVGFGAAALPPVLRTMSDLIEAYERSEHFNGLAVTTQRGYRQCLLRLRSWAGDSPIAAITDPMVQGLKKSFSTRPSFGNAIIVVLRLLFEWGRLHGYCNPALPNPARRPNLAGTEPTGLIWPREAVQTFVATADRMGLPSIGDAVLLNSWMGQRQADILRMPRHILRGDTLVVRQHKTGAGVALPVGMIPHVMARLKAALARGEKLDPVPAQIIVSEETGRGYLADNFRRVFARVRAEAAKTAPVFEIDHLMPGRDMSDPDAFKVRMMDLTFMALRHTAITRLAETECDADLISSISGHSLVTIQHILERYMVRTSKMARLAFGKRLAAEGLTAPVTPAEKETDHG